MEYQDKENSNTLELLKIENLKQELKKQRDLLQKHEEILPFESESKKKF